MDKLKIIINDGFIYFAIETGLKQEVFKEKFQTENIKTLLSGFLLKLDPELSTVPHVLVKTLIKMKNRENCVLFIDAKGTWYKKTTAQVYQEVLKAGPVEANTLSNSSISEQIMKELKQNLLQNPGEINAYQKYARACLELKKYVEAIDILREAIEKFPKEEDLYYNLARVYQSQGSFELALLEFDEVLKLNQDHHLSYFEIGNIYTEKEKYHEAMKAYHNAIIARPVFTPAYISLGIVYLRMEYPDEAIYIFEEVLSFEADNQEAEKYLKEAQALKKQLQATELNNLGIAYAEKGKYDKAIEKFRAALLLFPDDSEIYFNLGFAYLKKNELTLALQQFQLLLEREPDFAEAHRQIAQIYEKQEKPLQALNSYQKGLPLLKDPQLIEEIRQTIASLEKKLNRS